ncbi:MULTISPECIES: DegV family protein [unclassified Fusibacter]|uniref:DegV family protein n=1 Tax=unclassified Fusibacter TaxID=2624464 RepID=UPI00101372A3|nr:MULTISPECIES: DegV family protein [unclassified Fusibacter]MCK8060488.1 DegV family protein [Fusibacter sp. A2]NPE20223.1 DegV family protein [Fusibacter sp. A1]RXV63431.1 DegV family protein [Fusibacter sp. A1]
MFKIISDSTCDLSDALIKQYQIGIAPLKIVIDGVTYSDRVDMFPEQFYGMIEGLKTPATTAMPSPDVFLKLMVEAMESGHKEILCITMSSGTSGSYQSATIARDMFYETYDEKDVKIHIVDSLCMSHGSGYLILKSAKLREQGMSFEDVVRFNETFKKHVKHFLSVDDLDHLIRSGRLTNASAMIGKLLKIKPIMSMRDGKGAIVAKERGRKGVMRHMIKAFNQRVDNELTDFIIVGFTSDRAYAENLKSQILSETEFKGDILIEQMGVAVGVHVGLGGLSMYFIEKDRQRDGLLSNELENMKAMKEEMKEKLNTLKQKSGH